MGSVLPVQVTTSTATSNSNKKRKDDNDSNHNNNPLPLNFFLDDGCNQYIKPQIGNLVSYLWTKGDEKIDTLYRTGLLVSNDGKILFFNDHPQDPRHDFMEIKFHLNKKLYHTNQFRVRADLFEGAICYDWSRHCAWELIKINNSNGAVLVKTATSKNSTDQLSPSEAPVWVSPDFLVGNYTPRPPEVSVEDKVATESMQEKRQDKPRKKRFLGVFEPSPRNYLDNRPELRCYFRGRLCVEETNNSIPYLLEGESVHYAPDTMRVVRVEVLKFCYKTSLYLAVVGKDAKRCRKLAQQAEMKHAELIRIDQKKGLRTNRPTSLGFRPGQPVFVTTRGKRARITQAPDAHDRDNLVKVTFDDDPNRKIEHTERLTSIRLIVHENEPFDLDTFFLSQDVDLANKAYSKGPDYLLKLWKQANPKRFLKMEEEFKKRVDARKKIRFIAGGGTGDGQTLSCVAAERLKCRTAELLQRLTSDYFKPDTETMMTPEDFKHRIDEIKKYRVNPNFVLLCGGFAPELVAYKRLSAASLGTVILQDTDLFAVGVAVAAHPDVEFALAVDKNENYPPGDIRHMRNLEVVREIETRIGGNDNICITNPCQSFSLAGKKEGFKAENGQLLYDSHEIRRHFAETSNTPCLYIAENVPSTREVNKCFNAYMGQGEKYFEVCGSICSPCTRRRRFATNRPPPICHSPGMDPMTSPPSLDGDLPKYTASAIINEAARIPDGRNSKNQSRRMTHPKLKKFPCLMNSNPKRHGVIWEQQNIMTEPIRQPMTPEEAELAMGYRPDEVGVTKYSAYQSVLRRIQQHDYERDGCLISLVGCGDEKEMIEEVDGTRRLQLLGNSQVVTLLEALLWNEQKLFPRAI